MSKSNAERQAKWREKNRAIFNLRRRNARKLQGSVSRAATGSDEDLQDSRRFPNGGAAKADDNPPPLNPRPTIDQLRELVKIEQEKPGTEGPVRLVVYRDDFQRVITEAQWKRLQERKSKAGEKGYVIDEFSQ